jgi:hypothetical protein
VRVTLVVLSGAVWTGGVGTECRGVAAGVATGLAVWPGVSHAPPPPQPLRTRLHLGKKVILFPHVDLYIKCLYITFA